MKPECLAAVKAAVGNRELSDKEVRGIEERLRGSMREVMNSDPQAFAEMSPSDRLLEAAKLARKNQLEDMAKRHAAVLGSLEKNARNDAFVDNLKPGEKVKGMLAQRFALHAKTESSVEAKIRALQEYYPGQIDAKTDRLLQDPQKSDAILKELHGEDSGDPEAKAGAKVIADIFEKQRQRFERAGVPVHKNERYHLPQAWDSYRMGTEDEFVKDGLAHFDLSQFIDDKGNPMSRDGIVNFLKESWLTLASGGAKKRAEGTARGSSQIGSNYNAPRQLPIKDAASWKYMMGKYGVHDSVDGVVREALHRRARDIALAEEDGPGGQAAVLQRLERAKTEDTPAATTAKQKEKLDEDYDTFKRFLDVQMHGHQIGNSKWAARMAAMRALVSSDKLGSLVSQIPSDTFALATHMKAMGWDVGTAKSFAKGALSPERKAFLRAAGMWLDNAQSNYARLGDTHLYNRASNFLHHGVYVLSAMRMSDRSHAGLLADSVMGTLGERTRQYAKLDDLPEKQKAWAQKYGFTQEHWDTMRMATPDTAYGEKRPAITPQSIYEIPDEQLAEMANRKADAVNAGLKAREQSFKDQVAREREWVATRALKLENWKGKIQGLIDHAQAKASVRAGKAEGVAAARAEMLRAQVERAEVETDINRHLATEDHQGRMASYLDAVEEGANRERNAIRTPGVDERVNRAVQDFATKVGDRGERLGQARARAEARIAAAEKRLRDAERSESDRLDKKQDEFDKEAARRAKDLAEFSEQMRNRAATIHERIKAFEGERQKYTADTVMRLKDDTVKQILASYQSAYHAAARGFAKPTLAEQDRLGLLNNPAGTWTGEALRALWSIRTVPIGMAMTHYFDVPRGMEGWQPRAKYIASYAAGQVLATGLAVQLKHLMRGEDPEDMTKLHFWKQALSGAVLGPMLANVVFGSQGEHSDFGSSLGPIGDAFGLGYGLTVRAVDELYGKPPGKTDRFAADKYGAQWLSFVRNNAVPFMNMWWTKAVFNHLIYQQLQEKISPGYNDRVRKRMDSENTHSWWDQGELLPSRAPDWGAAIGQPSASPAQ